MCQLLGCENVVVALAMEATQGCLGVAKVLLLSTREGAFCHSGLGVLPVEFVSADTTGGKRDRGQAQQEVEELVLAIASAVLRKSVGASEIEEEDIEKPIVAKDGKKKTADSLPTISYSRYHYQNATLTGREGAGWEQFIPRNQISRSLVDAATECDANGASDCSFLLKKIERRMLYFVDKTEIQLSAESSESVLGLETADAKIHRRSRPTVVDVVKNGRIDSGDNERSGRYVAAVGKQGKDRSQLGRSTKGHV
ncbi:hypothetical protein B296_00010051 [Ensete ventricosum]|uniref:Uncharacterized protein n=1 Tax=Ensete ventricosum TaxID=4639 RepID=A0A426ZUJ0_ENSVE|nr:hypothetical protein B296_00010051 [Ensete ventricosum]